MKMINCILYSHLDTFFISFYMAYIQVHVAITSIFVARLPACFWMEDFCRRQLQSIGKCYHTPDWSINWLIDWSVDRLIDYYVNIQARQRDIAMLWWEVWYGSIRFVFLSSELFISLTPPILLWDFFLFYSKLSLKEKLWCK